jgi:GNAT superfamily N-acetyltransferase
MTIRRAKLTDYRQLTSIDLAGRADRERRAWLKRAVREHGVWVLTISRAIVAYAIMRKRFFDRPFIEMLYVAESERRKGYGEQLLARLEAEGLRAGEIWTSTNRSNRAMRLLLKKRGYLPSGQVTGLDHNDPEIICVKRTDAGLS